ncbi:predicted protein [Histoplasma mississippiense (nom. inval.)]|uniref:predicted protein n=1 Tax=Ajellomyces capsulatus (strain NAm1 / WU24) TaxID=2059318 RepID=UPI000157B763|nr:predicted protein [Histoplasma mississippiense (nom. inval.)]EDN03441.1 predicted protein [Histoplasma mississippiense (nom. inval.)]
MDPYVHTSPTDLYANLPLYGRCRPEPGHFHVKTEHVGSQSSDCESVIGLYDESIRIYPAGESGRDVFAPGNVIVKSSHPHDTQEIACSFADANEVDTISIAKNLIQKYSQISLIRGRQVLIQERSSGVALCKMEDI